LKELPADGHSLEIAGKFANTLWFAALLTQNSLTGSFHCLIHQHTAAVN